LPEYLQTEDTPIDSNWTDLKGYAFASSFATRNAEELIERCIKVTTEEKNLVLDFFLGSGTTAAVAHKLRRKWIGIEMAEYFNTEVLPRMKKVVHGEQSEISKTVGWNGGGFFKYYEMEQYENTLAKAVYRDADLFSNPYQDKIGQYIFLKDEKMLKSIEVNYENNQIKLDLSKLFSNIDIPETMSNLIGKSIRKVNSNEVEFENGEIINFNKMDYKNIKPLIWW